MRGWIDSFAISAVLVGCLLLICGVVWLGMWLVTTQRWEWLAAYFIIAFTIALAVRIHDGR